MARYEADHDDLMREVTGLVPRVELRGAEFPEPVIAGHRRDGGLSLYFGPDPVYHFDSEGRLRRAFIDGSLYRTQGTTLARLTRHRTETSSELLRYDLPSAELALLIESVRTRLRQLRDALGAVDLVEEIPPGAEFISQLSERVREALTADPPLAPLIKR